MKTVLVTGMGRSGSTFLANLVNRSSNATGRHEYFADKFFQGLSYYSPDHPHLAAQLIARAKDMEQSGTDLLVDADPFLRYGLRSIREVWPEAPVYHLVRDGRKVVASMYQRTSYTPREKKQPILPLNTAEYEQWRTFSRFEKLCWYWADTLRTMLEAKLPILRLEEITTDFSILERDFLHPCGIDLPKQEWDNLRSHRANTNRFHPKYLFRGKPPVLAWDDEKESQFQTLCGERMKQAGYC